MSLSYKVYHLNYDVILHVLNSESNIEPKLRENIKNHYASLHRPYEKKDIERVPEILNSAHALFKLKCYDHVATVTANHIGNAVKESTVSTSDHLDWWEAPNDNVTWVSDDVRRSTQAHDILINEAGEAYLVQQFVNWSFQKEGVAIYDDYVSEIDHKIESTFEIPKAKNN